MATRILSGIILSPLLLIILIKGVPLYIAGLLLAIIAIREFTNALKVKDIDVYPILGYSLAVMVFLKNLLKLSTKITFMLAIIIFAITLIYFLLKNKKILDLLKNILGITYIIFGFDAIVIIATNFTDGDKYVWLVFIIALLSDTMAYFVGSMFGKHKLAPKLSPKKTIEGSLGAIIFSSIGCLLFGYIFELNLAMMLTIGMLGSIVSQIGDLIASFVKRYVGIKDYGNLIPGHGGILDRFDSIILVSQFIYLILSFIKIV